MFALAITALDSMPAAPSAKPAVRVYSAETFTGDDARIASSLATRIASGVWSHGLSVGRDLLTIPGVRSALGERLAARLDFLAAGDSAREAKAVRKADAARTARSAALIASWGDAGTLAPSLTEWPRVRHTQSGTWSITRRGHGVAHSDAEGRDYATTTEVEAAYRRVLIGQWERVGSDFGWVRGGFGYPPGQDRAVALPRGVVIDYGDSWTSAACGTHVTLLIPVDAEAREQMEWLEELVAMAGAAYGAACDMADVAPLLARMEAAVPGRLGKVVWGASSTPDMVTRWKDGITVSSVPDRSW